MTAALVALGVVAVVAALAMGDGVALLPMAVGIVLFSLAGALVRARELHAEELEEIARMAGTAKAPSVADAPGAGGHTAEAEAPGAGGHTAEADAPGAGGTRGQAAVREGTTSTPAHGAPAAARPSATPEGEIDPATLDSLITRSSDVVATLKDLARSHPEGALVESLRRSGILDWEGAPALRGSILARNGRVWLGVDPEQIEGEGSFDALVGGEAAINCYRDALATDGEEPIEERMRRVVADTRRLAAPPLGEGEGDPGGEWDARVRMAEFAEGVAAPVRFAFDMQADVAHGAFLLDLEVPRPAAFAFLYDDEERRSAAALGYALDLAILHTRCVFRSMPRMRHLDLRCHEHGEADPMMALSLSRADFDALSPRLVGVGRGDALFDPASATPGVAPTGESPTLRLLGGHMRLDPGEHGWGRPFVPARAFDEGGLHDDARWRPVELRRGTAPAAVAAAIHAPGYAGLGISEDAGRTEAWEWLRPSLGGTVSSAVRSLVRLRDDTDDLTVAAAAQRLSEALVSGEADVADEGALRKVFLGGDELSAACADAQAQLASPSPESLPETLATLERALSPVEDAGLYRDDSETVFRYFNSMDERLAYNWALAEKGRNLRLVPDGYFAAEALAAQLAEAVDHHESALAHAAELARVAPATLDATLVRVRVLEQESAVFEAIEALKEAIPLATQPHKLALAFYRLAYMEWKAGSSQLAAACYVRSMELSPLVVGQAQAELEALLEAEGTQRRPEPDQARALILDAGIPLGDVELWQRRIRAAVVAATDDNVLSASWHLLGSYLEGSPNDVLADVYRSVRPPE